MYYLFISITSVVLVRNNENALLLSIRMDFFDKLKSTLSSPLKNFQGGQAQFNESCTIKTWTFPIANFSINHIRLLLYRDCDRRGRKCLYDSHHVIRDKNGKFSYITAGASTNCSEMKDLSEYIFGCVPLLSNCGNKRFHKYNGKYIWSQVFSPKKCNNTSTSGTSTPCSQKSTSSYSPVALLSQSPACTGDQVDGSCVPKMGLVTSLPNIVPACTPNFSKCSSLPSKLLDSHQKTLLGLGIMIETTVENKDVLGPYLQVMSGTIEECSTWFSVVASQAYCNPSTFVQTLYDFTTQFTNMFYARLSTPLVSPLSLTPQWKSLPPLTAELTQLLLQHDERHCKLSERIKLVIIGGSKKNSEVAALLYLLKILLLQCNRNTDMDVGIDATAFCGETTNSFNLNVSPRKVGQGQSHATLKSYPLSFESNSVSMSSSSAAISMSSTCASMSSASSPPSPPLPQPATLIHQITFTHPKVQEEKLQKQDYDSGIELELDCSSVNLAPGVKPEVKSMRRSVSQKFDSGCGSSSDTDEHGWNSTSTKDGRRHSRGNHLLPLPHSHEFEEVCFHLGDLNVDSEQSFNSLALSEPNLNKLKIYHGSPPLLGLVETNTKIEKLSPEPIQVRLNFESPLSLSKPVTSHCPYCDSIAIVPKFSPLYYIQWIKSTCCSTGLSEDTFNLMKSFSTSKFIVINLDKSIIRTINFDPNETKNLPPSCNSNSTNSLVNNLLHNLQLLSASPVIREAEIEHFLQVQLDFIKKIAHEFGESWLNSRTHDSSLKKKYSYLSLSDNDLKLIYSLAKMKFPSLAHGD